MTRRSRSKQELSSLVLCRPYRPASVVRGLAGLLAVALLVSACASGGESAAPESSATSSPAPAVGNGEGSPASVVGNGEGSPASAEGNGEGSEDGEGQSDLNGPAISQEEFIFRVELETERCMAAKGWEYEPMDRDFIDQMLNSNTDNNDPEGFARRFGYGIAGYEGGPDQTTSGPDYSYLESLSDAEEQAYFNDFGVCYDESAETAAGPGGLDVMNEQFIAEQELIAADPALIEARKRWSLCMVDAGYSYATPEDAFVDMTARFDDVDQSDQAALDRFKAEEIAVAVADLECQTTVDLKRVLEEARARASEQVANG